MMNLRTSQDTSGYVDGFEVRLYFGKMSLWL